MSDEEWVVVGKRGKSSNGHRGKLASAEENDQRPFLGDCTDPAVCRQSIDYLTDKLRKSKFAGSLKAAFSKSAEHLKNVNSIRCYGTGSPSASLEARSQLALLPLLQDMLSHKGEALQVQVYDPVLSDMDKQVIKDLGGTILLAEEAMQHTCSEKTLFYMPHCDAALYNEVLESNWSIHQLSDLSFLGNSFSHMEDRWSMPTFKRRTGRPHRLIALVEHGLVREEHLQGGAFTIKTAFNDTSLHWFEPEPLHDAPELFRIGTAMDIR